MDIKNLVGTGGARLVGGEGDGSGGSLGGTGHVGRSDGRG